ncbi:unnamed protein product [Notodromas monacha]|uniref:Uncharacterized protein n=1 Tax=Notodromas monacha TaxID=399045 RepID=A0A7R9BYK0_9CRUS|nr:unnamed protein product [Notodromas monacha]CAG0922981.1 unnamed protein product [Notodromas monacha]
MIIQKFSKRPMEDVKFVEDSISNFNVKIEKLTDQINTLNAQNAEEKRMRNELEEKLNEVAENKEMLVKQLENQKTPSTKAKKSIVKKILSILILIEPIISAISTVFNSAKDLVR